MREMGVGLRGLIKYSRRVGTLKEKCLRRYKTMGKYRKERNLAMKKTKTTMCL